MRKIHLYAILTALLAGALFGCESLEDTYSEYAGDGPIRYLTKCYNLDAVPEWEEVELTWENKTDVARDAILVEWEDDNTTRDSIIDKDATSCVIPNLENYEYGFSVTAISYDDDMNVTASSLKSTIYARPYTFEHEALSTFSRVVIKQFKVGDSKLMLFFDSWKSNLLAVEIGYYKTGETSETRLTLSKQANGTDYWPNGQKYLLLPGVDQTKAVTVYRTGTITEMSDPDFSLEFPTIQLNLDVLAFNSDFATQVKNYLNVSELDASAIENVEVLELDQDLTSLEDILYFPNLKELYLGKNRYMTSTYASNSSAQSTLTDKERSLAVLNVAHNQLQLDVHQYNAHYLASYEAPSWFVKGGNPVVPMLEFYATTGWSYAVTPVDQTGYNSYLVNLFDGLASTAWTPLIGSTLRVHQIEIDLGTEVDVRGFKLVQSATVSSSLVPNFIKIEMAPEAGQYAQAAFAEEIPLGDSNGETNIIYLNKEQTTQKARRIRIFVTDKDYYSTSYGTALADFMVIK